VPSAGRSAAGQQLLQHLSSLHYTHHSVLQLTPADKMHYEFAKTDPSAGLHHSMQLSMSYTIHSCSTVVIVKWCSGLHTKNLLEVGHSCWLAHISHACSCFCRLLLQRGSCAVVCVARHGASMLLIGSYSSRMYLHPSVKAMLRIVKKLLISTFACGPCEL